jgi:hypothetical protein
MTTSINEDICSLKLQLMHHEGHIERVAKVNIYMIFSVLR